MTETSVTSRRKALKSPRSAAIAGIIFSVLYGTSMVLINISLPHEPAAGFSWLETDVRTVTLALNLIPYAGIAFLWFIGVIRDLLSDMEDRLFATVFLGSGLLFLALTFMGAALAGGLLSSYAIESSVLVQSGVLSYSRKVIYHIFNIYAIRMAGVFMISLGHHLAPHRSDAPWLGFPDLHLGAGAAPEYRLFLLGDLDLPGVGAGGQCVYPDPEPAQSAQRGYTRG
jgi:hypothetical protein